MRIRRRVAESPPQTQATSPSRTRSPPPRPPPAPPRASAPCSETAEEPSASEANRSTCGVTTDDHWPPPHDRNRQEEVEEKDAAVENEKRGQDEDGRSEHEHQRPVHVVCSAGTTPKGEEEERRADVDVEKREDPGRLKDEEKTTVRICKKGDGKGWQCKRAAQPGYSLCQYHLDKLRSYSCHSQKKKPKAASPPGKPAAAGTQSPRASQQLQKKKRTEERVVSTRPGSSDSYYYYSGFGPGWGKRGRNRSADGVKPLDTGSSDQVPPQEDVAAAAAAGEEEEEADEVEEEDYDCDRESRDGKPPKSRRLSSLL